MDRDEFTQWQSRMEGLEQQLTRIEHGVKTILADMGCPTDPVHMYAMLAGERKAPWTKRTAERSQRRARYAMHAILHIGIVRANLGPLNPDALRAADAALMVGWLANQLGLELANTARATQGGVQTGQQMADKAAAKDQAITRHARQWKNSDELQEQFPRSSVGYIHKMTQIPTRTIQSRLKALASSSRK